jgi:hypothetical protein
MQARSGRLFHSYFCWILLFRNPAVLGTWRRFLLFAPNEAVIGPFFIKTYKTIN